MSQQYIVIIQSCWCNETGSGIHYGWDGGRFDTREEAIAEGFELRESDDFNIGVIDGEKLVSFDWMNEPIGDPPEVIAEISSLIGLEGVDQ